MLKRFLPKKFRKRISKIAQKRPSIAKWFCGVMVSTLDFESCNCALPYLGILVLKPEIVWGFLKGQCVRTTSEVYSILFVLLYHFLHNTILYICKNF